MDHQVHEEIRLIQRNALQQLKENWKWYFLLGAGLAVIGALGIMYAFTATLISVVYLGALLVVAGFFEAMQAFRLSKWDEAFLRALLSILYIAAGFFMIFQPAINALTLTLVLAAFFVISGIMKIIFSATRHVPHKGWLLLSGIVSIFLGVLIWTQWPYSGLWVLGTLVGIELLFTGSFWIMLALKARKLSV